MEKSGEKNKRPWTLIREMRVLEICLAFDRFSSKLVYWWNYLKEFFFLAISWITDFILRTRYNTIRCIQWSKCQWPWPKFKVTGQCQIFPKWVKKLNNWSCWCCFLSQNLQKWCICNVDSKKKKVSEVIFDICDFFKTEIQMKKLKWWLLRYSFFSPVTPIFDHVLTTTVEPSYYESCQYEYCLNVSDSKSPNKICSYFQL